MSSIICDMNCDQETNKSVIGKHCFDCLCTGELAGVGHEDMPARKARRSTNVVEERGRPDTLSQLCDGKFSISQPALIVSDPVQISQIRQAKSPSASQP